VFIVAESGLPVLSTVPVKRSTFYEAPNGMYLYVR